MEGQGRFGMGKGGDDGVTISGHDPAGNGRNSMSDDITPSKEAKQE